MSGWSGDEESAIGVYQEESGPPESALDYDDLVFLKRVSV
jgi:hypothetical protein